MKRVAQYDPDSGALLAVFPSITAAAAAIFRAFPSNICACCRGRVPSAYGYMWRYYRIPRGERAPTYGQLADSSVDSISSDEIQRRGFVTNKKKER